MAVLGPKALVQLMAEMSAAAARDTSWGPSPECRERIEAAYEREFANPRDVVAVPCDRASKHRPDRAGP